MSASRSSHDASSDEHAGDPPGPQRQVTSGMPTAEPWEIRSQHAGQGSDRERALVAALCLGDEAAFEELIDLHHASLVRLARVWIRDTSVAEEVAQETWLTVLQGIHGFEGRSPLRSWIFGILANKAKRRGTRESRSRPFSAYGAETDRGDSSGIGPDHFFPPGHEWAGHWTYPLADEQGCPERHTLAEEMGGFILRKIDELPVHYRAVILLRDLHGLTGEETCTMLGITAANQRVILHRARTRLRAALEPYLKGSDHVAHG